MLIFLRCPSNRKNQKRNKRKKLQQKKELATKLKRKVTTNKNQNLR